MARIILASVGFVFHAAFVAYWTQKGISTFWNFGTVFVNLFFAFSQAIDLYESMNFFKDNLHAEESRSDLGQTGGRAKRLSFESEPD